MPKKITEFSEKLKPYLGVHVGKDYFTRGDFCDNETFETVCTAYANWYEKNKTILIKNIMSVYALTGNETGYNAMVEDWERRRNWKEVGGVVRFDAKFIDKQIIDHMGLVMNHFYQQNRYGKKDSVFESSMVGLLLIYRLHVDIRPSEKRKKKDVIFDYGIDISIGSSNHTEIEIHE